MRISWEKIFFLVVFAALAAGALFWFKPWPGGKAPPARVRETTIRVVEGVVEVYELDPRGKPREKRTLFPGESLVVRKLESVPPSSAAPNILQPLAARAAGLARSKAAEAVRDLAPGRRSRLITEEDLDRFLISELSRKHIASEASVRITREGLDVSAKIRPAGPIEIPVTGRGIVRLGPDRKLYLELREVKLGFVSLPPFALRGIEDAFDAEMAQGTPPIEILDLDYSDSGIQLSFRRI